MRINGGYSLWLGLSVLAYLFLSIVLPRLAINYFGQNGEAVVTRAFISEGSRHTPSSCVVSVNFQAAKDIAPNESFNAAPERCDELKKGDKVAIRFFRIGETVWVAPGDGSRQTAGFRL